MPDFLILQSYLRNKTSEVFSDIVQIRIDRNFYIIKMIAGKESFLSSPLIFG